MMDYQEILDFWFAEETKSAWFNSTKEMDQLIRQRFETTWKQARDGQLDDWLKQAKGCLALVILLDQFPLNMFRGDAKCFATEEASRIVSRNAIEKGFDKDLDDTAKAFLYMPFMHSESLDDQDYSVSLFEQAKLNDNIRWAKHHRDIIKRFGRFPHRNSILGRESSAEEIDWLNSEQAFKG